MKGQHPIAKGQFCWIFRVIMKLGRGCLVVLGGHRITTHPMNWIDWQIFRNESKLIYLYCDRYRQTGKWREWYSQKSLDSAHNCEQKDDKTKGIYVNLRKFWDIFLKFSTMQILKICSANANTTKRNLSFDFCRIC